MIKIDHNLWNVTRRWIGHWRDQCDTSNGWLLENDAGRLRLSCRFIHSNSCLGSSQMLMVCWKDSQCFTLYCHRTSRFFPEPKRGRSHLWDHLRGEHWTRGSLPRLWPLQGGSKEKINFLTWVLIFCCCKVPCSEGSDKYCWYFFINRSPFFHRIACCTVLYCLALSCIVSTCPGSPNSNQLVHGGHSHVAMNLMKRYSELFAKSVE